MDERTMVEQLRPVPGLVVLMCGIAGSGKTTVALDLERAGFTRLSIDEEIWTRFGRYGVDYEPAQYQELQGRALEAIEQQLQVLLAEQAPVVLDLAFWNRAERQRFRELIARAGGTSQIVYLNVAPHLLQARLEARSTRFDANAAFPISPSLLDQFLRDFEAPSGEGELVIEAE